MTEELSKEELLAWFDDLACGEESIDMWTLEESKQANQQIRKLIENYDVMETYKKDWEHPKVSKEFVERWVLKFQKELEKCIFRKKGKKAGPPILIPKMLQEAGVKVEE